MENNRLTPEDADALRAKAAQKSVERDVAVDVAVRASMNEATAKEAARNQGMAARRAEAQAAEMNTLRQVANTRANQEEQSAETSRFGFYLLTGILLSALVLVVAWLATRAPETNVSIPSGGPTPGQSGLAPVTPYVAPPTAIPGPRGPQGVTGSPAPQGVQGPSGRPGPSGPPGASGPAGTPGPSGPAGSPGASAPVAPPSPTSQ